MQDFRVIGVGHGIEAVIDQVKSFGFDGVSTEVVKYPFECTPDDNDKLAIIVFTDCDDNANKIAKTFHEAGVLTVGFSEDAEASCYDSIMQNISATDSPQIIKELLLPLVTPGIISYDYHDLVTSLRDSGFFIVKTIVGDNVADATEKLRALLATLDLKCIDYLSVNLYLNSYRLNPADMSDMGCFSGLMSNLPENVHAIWAVNHDEKINGKETKMTVILAGKEVWKCSIK